MYFHVRDLDFRCCVTNYAKSRKKALRKETNVEHIKQGRIDIRFWIQLRRTRKTTRFDKPSEQAKTV